MNILREELKRYKFLKNKMVNGNELRRISRSILDILEAGKISTLDDLEKLKGMKVPFPNQEVLEVDTGISGYLLNPKKGVKIFYSRPGWGTILNAILNQYDNFIKIFLKTSANVSGYTDWMVDGTGRTVFEQTFPGCDVDILKEELKRLSDAKYYIKD